MYEIEKNVPMPESKGGPGARKYPFANMKKGDSFFIADGGEPYKTQSRIVQAASRGAAKMNGAKFTTRLAKGGVRVWRIE